MPYYAFREIWTPLALFSIRFYRELSEGDIYIKIGRGSRRRLFLGHKTL